MNEKKSDNHPMRVIASNPVLILFLGACPAMAQTASVISALGMGVAVLLVLLLSGIVISALRRVIPEKAKLPAYIIIIAAVVSVVQMLMHAFLPKVYQMLGVYLAVTAVDLLVFSRGEEHAAGHGVLDTLVDSLATGFGFAVALFCMAAVREIFGSGTFAGLSVPLFETYHVPLLTKAPGGFLVFSIFVVIVNAVHPGRGGTEQTGLARAAAGIAGSAATETQGE